MVIFFHFIREQEELEIRYSELNAIVNKRVLSSDNPRPTALHEQSCKHLSPSDSLHARHVSARVRDGGRHVGARGGQVLLCHIYTLPVPATNVSTGATCLKNRV